MREDVVEKEEETRRRRCGVLWDASQRAHGRAERHAHVQLAAAAALLDPREVLDARVGQSHVGDRAVLSAREQAQRGEAPADGDDPPVVAAARVDEVAHVVRTRQEELVRGRGDKWR